VVAIASSKEKAKASARIRNKAYGQKRRGK
jgi:hypothetical protein